ncbi:MAG: MFS transporter [Pseudomonadota bacterium]|nr:MFS transporter [Pseudomonadota bacterium]
MSEDSSILSNSSEEEGLKVGFLYLAPGISKLNLFAYFYAAFATIGLLTFISTGTAQVLNAMGIPIDEHGAASGNLVIMTEITQILAFGIVGVLADRIGRREVAAVGMFVMGLGYAFYPYAESLPELLIYRAMYGAGLGAATGMVGTLIADYAGDKSRAKFVAVGGIFNGIGVIFVTVIFGANAAPMLVEAGYSPIEAMRITHWIVAGACFFSSIIYFLGLKKGTPGAKEERPPVKELLVSGYTEAINNPRIALSYACGFVARSDQVILGTFTVLWGSTVAVSQGADFATASGKGALLFAIAGTTSLLFLPFLGAILDKFNRVSGVIICMTLGALGYFCMFLVDETRMFNDIGFPLTTHSMVLFGALGAGQIAAFLGATILISAEAPKLKRGVVVGMFNIFGAIGIFVAVAIGGTLFDVWGGFGPFVLVGLFNAIVALLAIIVRIKSPGPMPVSKSAT